LLQTFGVICLLPIAKQGLLSLTLSVEPRLVNTRPDSGCNLNTTTWETITHCPSQWSWPVSWYYVEPTFLSCCVCAVSLLHTHVS